MRVSEPVKHLNELTFYRGRVALYAILKALGVGEGDEVATQSFTCLAMPEGIMATGAKPLWIDIEPGGVNMDPDDLISRITEKTKAVVVQHTFGIPAQMNRLVEICEERGLPLIEDCCHTYASSYDGRTVGTFGVGAFYSFEWGKPLVAGIGGSAVVQDENGYQKVKAFHDGLGEAGAVPQLKIDLQYAGYSMLYSPKRFWKVRELFQKLSAAGAAEGNYNPTGEVAADFGRKMAPSCRGRLEREVHLAATVAARSRELSAIYMSGISVAGLRQVFVPDQANPVYARFPLLAEDKQGLLARAKEANIEVAEWYSTAVHPLKPGDWSAIGLEVGQCPEAEKRSREIVSLPINKKTTDSIVDQTVGFLSKQ